MNPFARVGAWLAHALDPTPYAPPVDPGVPLDREAAEDAAYEHLPAQDDPNDDPEAGLTPFEVASRRYARYTIFQQNSDRLHAEAAAQVAREQALRRDITAFDRDTPDRSGFSER